MEKLREEVAIDVLALKMLAEIEEVKTMLQEVANILLDNHLHHCILRAVRSGDPSQVDTALGKLATLYALSSRLLRN